MAPACSDAAILCTERVRKAFGGLVAVDGVSIRIRRRSLTLLIGPNGSGKTTLLNVIAGYYRPEGGRIYYEGRDITRLPPHERFRLGIARTFQIPKPFKSLTVLENVLLAARDYEGEALKAPLARRRWLSKESELVERAFKILKLVGLDHLWDQPSGKLSGGQMKLLEIARALMSGAKLILMDEPIAGVNPTLAHAILGFMSKLREAVDVTFLVVEHRLDIAMKYADYVYAMAQGRVVAEGSPEEVVSHPKVVESYLGG